MARKLREDLPVARNIQEGYVAIMQTIDVRPCLLMVEGQSGDRFDRTAYEEGAARLADLIDPGAPSGEDKVRAASKLRSYGYDELKAGSLLKTLKDVTGTGDGSWRDVLLRLADLIEPVVGR